MFYQVLAGIWLLILINKDILIPNEKAIVAVCFVAFVYYLQANYADAIFSEIIDRVGRVKDRYQEYMVLVRTNLQANIKMLKRQESGMAVLEFHKKFLKAVRLSIRVKSIGEYASLIVQEAHQKLTLVGNIARQEIIATQRGVTSGIIRVVASRWSNDADRSKLILRQTLTAASE